MTVADSDLPQLFSAANESSLEGQRVYLRLTRWRLTAVVAASACGITSWRVGSGQTDLLGVVAILLFVAALLIEISLWREHPERAWYDGRALAESVKTLAWKFAVGGAPFSIAGDYRTVEADLIDSLNELRGRYRSLHLASLPGEAVTDWMRSTRPKLLDERRRIYISDRVLDQQNWYHSKSDSNAAAARRWKRALVTLEFLGAVAALVETLSNIDLFFSPTIAAAVGALVAWLETKQHDQLARAYATAVSDLGSALSKLKSVTAENDWAREMNDAEDAISREHTLWLASRSVA